MGSYLNKVFSVKNPSKEVDELKNFLLLSSSNDFFNLKNLLNDLSEFDSEGEQYLNTDTVKHIYKHYSDAAKVYDYINCLVIRAKRNQNRCS